MDGDINTLAPARVTATDSVARDVIDRGHPGIRPKTVRWFVIVGLLLGLILGGLYGFNRYREQATAQFFANNRPPPTSSNVIGFASAPSGSGNGTRRLSPPGNNGARIDGTMPGSLSAGESSLISAGAVAGSGETVHPFRLARSNASMAIVTASALRKIQRKVASSAYSDSQA